MTQSLVDVLAPVRNACSGHHRVAVEPFDVHWYASSNTFRFEAATFATAEASIVRLERLQVIVGRGCDIDVKCQQYLRQLSTAKRPSTNAPHGLTVGGNLGWEDGAPKLFAHSIRFAKSAPIRTLLSATKVSKSNREVPLYPMRVAWIGRQTNACDDFRSAAGNAMCLTSLGAPAAGPQAAAAWAAALARLSRNDYDVAVVSRGGGSELDLMLFSHHELINATQSCSVPVLVAIGHTRDVPLVYAVADRYENTPSEAGRWVRGRCQSSFAAGCELIRQTKSASARYDKTVATLRADLLAELDEAAQSIRRRRRRCFAATAIAALALVALSLTGTGSQEFGASLATAGIVGFALRRIFGRRAGSRTLKLPPARLNEIRQRAADIAAAARRTALDRTTHDRLLAAGRSQVRLVDSETDALDETDAVPVSLDVLHRSLEAQLVPTIEAQQEAIVDLDAHRLAVRHLERRALALEAAYSLHQLR